LATTLAVERRGTTPAAAPPSSVLVFEATALFNVVFRLLRTYSSFALPEAIVNEATPAVLEHAVAICAAIMLVKTVAVEVLPLSAPG
jgi:hypothetical protein